MGDPVALSDASYYNECSHEVKRRSFLPVFRIPKPGTDPSLLESVRDGRL